MTLYINTNVASMRAQSYLNKTTDEQTTTYQRLSSGYRINTAMDDPAGVQIADRLQTAIDGISMGNRNANDGISFAQTAEGALEEVTTMLQTIRTSAVQSATGTLTSQDRESIQKEVAAYNEEICRIAEETTFANVGILNGSGGKARFQVNNDPNSIVEIDLTDSFTMLSIARTALDNMEETTLVVMSDEDFENRFGTGYDSACDDETDNIYIRQSVAESLVAGQIGDGTLNDSILDTNDDGTSKYYTAPADGENGTLTINKYNVDSLINGARISGDANNVVLGAVFGLEVTGGGDGLTADYATVDVTTAANAQGAIKYCDEWMNVIDTKRAELGAIENRLESTISNQSNVSENVSEAKSRITDTDFAEETAKLAAQDIIMQASATILAQANTRPEIALNILSASL